MFRVSAKALVVRDGKLLLAREDNGKWELPGGGIDSGEDLREALVREIREETGLVARVLNPHPIYVWPSYNTGKFPNWLLLGYHVELESLDFIPSDECQELKFFDAESARQVELFGNVTQLFEFFDPADF